MQPNPVSAVKALCARFCIRTLKLMAAVAFGSWLFCMGGKPDLYVIHMRDSKSSRKGCGQPPHRAGSSPFVASLRSSSRLVRIQLSSSVAPVRSECGAGEDAAVVEVSATWAGVDLGGGGFGSYCWPRHHMGHFASLAGWGS